MGDAKLHCPDCGHSMPLPPQRCPVCGEVMTLKPQRRSMSPVIVVLLLFLLIGPFGLPLLWRNDRFSVLWKWILTVLVAIYTAIAMWYVYDIVREVNAEVDKALGQLQMP